MRADISKLVIGTAQWGLDYGISNPKGKTSKEEIIKIISNAHESGINSFDTASEYGNAEKLIGELTSRSSKITTKIVIGCQKRSSEELQMETEMKVKNSIKNLGNRVLTNLLIHDPENLEKNEGSPSWETLMKLKKNKQIEKIGLSVYNPTQAEVLATKFRPDIIQLPLNVFDKRAINLGTLAKLKKQGIEVHARSLFLQGLILMKLETIDDYFKPWSKNIESWHDYCTEKGWSLLEGALTYIFMEPYIDKCIIGIANSNQLNEIIGIIESLKRVKSLKDFSSTNEKFIDPSQWRI